MIRLRIEEYGRPARIVHSITLPVVVGRSADADLVIERDDVSGHHGRMTLNGDSVSYADLGSTNGTRWIRGSRKKDVPVGRDRAVELRPGDQLLLGDPRNPLVIRYEGPSEQAGVSAAKTRVIRTEDLEAVALETQRLNDTELLRSLVDLADPQPVEPASWRERIAYWLARLAPAPIEVFIFEDKDPYRVRDDGSLVAVITESADVAEEALATRQAMLVEEGKREIGVLPFDPPGLNIRHLELRGPKADAMVLAAFESVRVFLYFLASVLSERSERSLLEQENRRLRAQSGEHTPARETSNNPRMQAVLSDLDLAAKSAANLLLLGETGVGKEVMARRAHLASARGEKPFHAVNCAAFHRDLLESQLFGHEAGAFTGARSVRRGVFELADGGTLFLDEVGEIDPGLQAKLLRVLETRSFQRLGSEQTLESDFRLVCATNRDLERAVQSGEFRADLYYRISVYPVRIPPLRDRREDVPDLARAFLRELSARDGMRAPALDSGAEQLLSTYDWPGNIRELRNEMERALIRSRGAATLTAAHLTLRPAEAPTTGPEFPTEGASFAELEREIYARALDRCDGNQRAAAEVLKLNYTTFRSRLARAGVLDDSE